MRAGQVARFRFGEGADRGEVFKAAAEPLLSIRASDGDFKARASSLRGLSNSL